MSSSKKSAMERNQFKIDEERPWTESFAGIVNVAFAGVVPALLVAPMARAGLELKEEVPLNETETCNFSKS